MRNEAMEQLDVLVGSWQATMRNAWFLEPADQEVAGSATVEWLGEAFVVFRWTMEGDVGKSTSDMVLVLGRSDARDAYTAFRGRLPTPEALLRKRGLIPQAA